MAKLDLTLTPPIMNAAGTLGFSPKLHGPIDWSHLGAFVTNPVSQTPRTPAHGEHFAAYPAGFVLHTGYPNPGFNQVLRRYARQWSRAPLPVILHLLVQGADGLARMVRQLEGVEGISGLEIGLPAGVTPQHVTASAQAAAGELPVILRLPFENALELAPAAIQAGAMAVSLAPPRGTSLAAGGTLLQGRLYGPAIFPLALRLVQELVRLGIPTIGAGGVYRREQSEAMLSSGAMAVQIDAALWKSAGHKIF